MELPIEVLVYLLKYLPHSDRAAAAKTCRQWYEAASDCSFQNKEKIKFIKNILQDDTYPCSAYSCNSLRAFTSFSFHEVDMTNKMSNFWEDNGYIIKNLELHACDIQEKTFITILSQCPNLQSLTVSNCRELFMSARFLEEDGDGLSVDSLKNIKKLDLSQNRYLSDALFNRFVASATSLEELDLTDCPVSFHSGLYKKFYPFGINALGCKTASENVLTFHYILEFLKIAGSNLKTLSFNRTLIDGSALKLICELPHIQLSCLEVSSCDQLNNEGLLSLTQHQNTLVKLDIGRCSRVTDQSLIEISKNLTNLQSLNINRCRAVTNQGVSELWNLKNLKYLDISQCELITHEGIQNGLCRTTNYTLKELNLCALNLDEGTVIMISEKLPNLQFLDINFCFPSVTDNSIQSVFKNLLHLHTLKMNHCDQVSDAGLTGMGTGKQDHSSSQETPIRNNVQTAEKFHRISLRSRAEEEIVRDARRKKDVREMCENFIGETIQGYSMARLKNLKFLDIGGCNRITDVSLKYAFNCSELKYLNLSECQQITCEGLQHLATNCRSLETIDLVNCYNIRDEGVGTLVRHLRRLKYLYIRGCNLLTDATLFEIRSECRTLKVLDIQGCRNMSPEAINSLAGLPTLHTLLQSKPGPYITEGVKNRLPAPPPLPALSNFRRRIF